MLFNLQSEEQEVVAHLTKLLINILLPAATWKSDIFDGEWSILRDASSAMSDWGMDIRFVAHKESTRTECDVLCVSSRCLDLTSKSVAWQEELKKLRSSTNKLIWFDMRDSAGTTQFEVMPFVDRYVKKQIYRDPRYYFDPPYGGRAYSQFYNRQYGVIDLSAYQMTPLSRSNYSKLCLGWNIGTSSFLARGPSEYRFLGKLKRRVLLEMNAFVGPARQLPLGLSAMSPSHERTNDILAVLGTDYARASVSFQRKLLLSKLNEKVRDTSIIGGRLSPVEFHRQLIRSKLVISAFGWGEVCFREFEATWAGAAFAMPDMSIIETWPDIYIPGETYIALPWDFESVNEILDDALSRPKDLVAMAATAQQRLLAMRQREQLGIFSQKFSAICGF